MGSIPEKLKRILEMFDGVANRDEREMLLLGYAERFRQVQRSIATPPYPEERKVPYCESDAYVWVMQKADGTISPHFAVENPSGVSAKALATILSEGLGGAMPGEAAAVSEEIVEQIFRQNISMGKGMGLTAMVRRTVAEARSMIHNPSTLP
jgi:cysteine desulfuration protein SufE